MSSHAVEEARAVLYVINIYSKHRRVRETPWDNILTCYLITFDTQSSDTREKLENQIRALDGKCWNGLEHIWMIKSGLSGLQVRDALRAVSAEADKIIVVLLAGWAIWHGFDEDAEKWLTEHL